MHTYVHVVCNMSHCYRRSCAIWDHTVLPSTQHHPTPANWSWYSVYWPQMDARM